MLKIVREICKYRSWKLTYVLAKFLDNKFLDINLVTRNYELDLNDRIIGMIKCAFYNNSSKTFLTLLLVSESHMFDFVTATILFTFTITLTVNAN